MEDTLECLASIHLCDLNETRVIVVDNGSETFAGSTIAEQFPSVTYIKSAVNSGWSGGNNLGIRESLQPGSIVAKSLIESMRIPTADVVLLLNNDTIVDDQILQVLRESFERGYDILGPVINEYDQPDVVQTAGVRFNPKSGSGFFKTIPIRQEAESNCAPSITDVDIVNGCAVAISKSVFDRIGLIDERFFLICEESDFCLRAQNAGFKLGVIHRSLVWHKHSVSFNRAGKPLQRYYGSRNLWLLLKKHPNGNGRRGRFSSVVAYCRHQYHLFCHEVELGNQSGASAIVDGMSDALLGRYGVRNDTRSWISRLGENMLYCVWRIRGGKKHKGIV